MTLEQSILATLAYHDIFDYPLTLQEVHNYLVNIEVRPLSVRKELNRLFLTGKIFSKSGYIFLKGRSKIVDKRVQRERASSRKFQKAVFFSNILKVNPFIKMVGITGALAMNNSDRNDDIDLFLITTKNHIWTARFISNLLMISFKRRPKSKLTKNKACLNIFVDESDLATGPQNIYIAHEICQMKPIWDQGGTYQKFISANKWVRRFLPNWQSNAKRKTQNAKRKKERNTLVVRRLALVVENLLKDFQLFYMRPKITTEKISDTQLFFHPAGTQERVMNEYQRRLKKLSVTKL